MKSALFVTIKTFLGGLLALVLMCIGTEQAVAGQPPVEQSLVREGTVAVGLVGALRLGTASNEAEAESMLGAAGISPRNGWIADYPVTPDIFGELQNAVTEAADSKRLPVGKDEALKAFQDVMSAYNLNIEPSDQSADSAGSYEPDSATLDDYYDDEGPPVVTYYTPPPDYYPYYTWVPYPFWCSDFWFPGFFVLVDFHKVVIVNKRAEVISNHVVDGHTHRMAVIDPASRMAVDPANRAGRGSFVGTGTSNARSGVPAAVKAGNGTVSGGGPRSVISNSHGTASGPSGAGRIFGGPSGGGKTFSSPSFGGGSTHCTARC